MDASLRARAEPLATECAGQAQTAEDLNGFMRRMMQSDLEQMLNTEMDVRLGRRKAPGVAQTADETGAATPSTTSSARRPPNRRNGRSRKTVQGDLGELATPRDRDGTFEPQLVGKHQRRLSAGRVRGAERYAADDSAA